MPYYHIKVVLETDDVSVYKQMEYELDLPEDSVSKFAGDYQNSDDVFLNKKWIKVAEISEIEIRVTPEKTTYYFPSLGYSSIFQSSAFPDVTREFLSSPPKRQIASIKSERTAQLSSKNIFIVHGSDHNPVNDLKTMLRDFGLDPLVLQEQASGGLTLAEKLEKYAGKVGFAFVILTPDDVGGQRDEMRKKLGADTEEKESVMASIASFLRRPIAVIGPEIIENILEAFEPRARQNVIFEMGYFWGTLGRKRVCFLLKGDITKPSDIDGIAYVQFKESVNEARTKIENELREAGYEIRK